MIDDPSDDFELQGWLELILGADRVAARALALIDASGPASSGAHVDDALVDAVLGIEVLARRVRAAAAELDADGAARQPRMNPLEASDPGGWLR